MDDEGRAPAIFTATSSDQALILRMVGEIDLASCGPAEAGLRAAVRALPPPSLVVVDLTAVEFFGAAGVRVLSQLVDVCATRGIGVHLIVAPSTIVRRIVSIARFDERVPTFDSLAQALEPGR